MSEIERIEACANVILSLCKEDGDLLVRLQSISYTAAVLKREADSQIEKMEATAESNHE
ncbi:hypothetical protein L3V59_11060 [Burkholderia aenigmatica]|uniref:hypothetical protein n=1 Tax=Burkholderia aenigmatica TaxID=2015348 RepID=UPI001F383370|nr:hypothetical protein [Burkholderia aenigmatica]UKD10246.1 hypothetical protein L3V59_11060 [Burkholderia aenigmatica]